MSGLKQEIPNLAALENKLNEIFEVSIVDFIANTKGRRQVVIQNRRYFTTAILTLIVSFIVLFFAYEYLYGAIQNLVLLFVFSLSLATIVFCFRFYREQKILAQELNMSLVPTISTCLNRQILYTHDEVHRKETEAMLRESELISNFDSIRADDMYSLFEPYPLTVREISVTRQESRGKNTTTVNIFHGVLVQVELKKTLSGITFISTEGDKGGFGHLSFWTGITEAHNVKETTLEWNEFEKDLHVATNDEIEARYILTPDFMLDLHTWWSEHKQNIRIVFKGNKMFMLLPDAEIKIATSTTSTDHEQLKQYALSVMKPLWRTVTLIEDLRL